MRKTWIKLKRGVLDPKHVQAVGPALWLFCLMIDGADWESGKVHAWTDRQGAADLGIKPNTARDWRQRLEKYGYIDCKQTGQALEVQIHNWTNPREYSGEVLNQARTRTADVGDAWGDVEGDVQTEPLARKGSVSGSVSGSVRAAGPFLIPQIHTSEVEGQESSQVICERCGFLVERAALRMRCEGAHFVRMGEKKVGASA